MSPPGIPALRSARDRARNRFVVVMVLLFLLGGGLRLAGAQWGGVLPVSLAILVLLVLVAWTLLGWTIAGWRLRRADDPWAYDAELDGPIAMELEGRSYGPPTAGKASPTRIFLGIAVGAALAAAAFWLAERGLAVWDRAAGYGPADLSAFGYLLGGVAAAAAAGGVLWVAWSPSARKA